MGGLDFSSFIARRTENFVGREWVFTTLNEWLDAGSTRLYLLAGGPGTGKSAIAARLAQMSDGGVESSAYSALRKGWLTYYHFCQAGHESTLSPITFVQCLSEALANRYEPFRRALQNSGSQQLSVNIQQIVTTGQTGSQMIGAIVNVNIKSPDARPMFDLAVGRPLRVLAKEMPEERITILLDSLDEAFTFNAQENITTLLRVINDFPPQVRFVCTCRSDFKPVFDIVGEPSLDLLLEAPPGLDEVKTYACARLSDVAEPRRSKLAQQIADKSSGNFLYAYYVLNDLVGRLDSIDEVDAIELPAELQDVYRSYIGREMASNPNRWNDIYRPLIGPIAVARGDGLTKPQLVGITNLAEDTAADVLKVCEQYLVGGGNDDIPYRLYHQSFREFLLQDKQYCIYPAERHAAIARYMQDKCGASWRECADEYALRYTPAHWADAATLSEPQRETRTQTLVDLVRNAKYQRRFERRINDLPMLQGYLERAVQVAALNERGDMLPWLVKAAQGFVAFRREYLQAEAVITLAEAGKLDQAEARLSLFPDVENDWQSAVRLILAWLALEKSPSEAAKLRDRVAQHMPVLKPLPLLRDRLEAALNGESSYRFDEQEVKPVEVGQQLVKRISGQAFDREMLAPGDPLRSQSEMIGRRGYAASMDGPILVNIARASDHEGTALLDEYIKAHAGYNYVQYRNNSLWILLHAVLRHHPNQAWVKRQLRQLAIAALSGGGVDFEEMLPLTVAALREREQSQGKARMAIDGWRNGALQAAQRLEFSRGQNDSWGNHKRRLIALMELYRLVLHDTSAAAELMHQIERLPDGFAGYQAPARLRLADAMRACRMDTSSTLAAVLEDALGTAHHIQDYHFCARITARCNALQRWHARDLQGDDLASIIHKLAKKPGDETFAADHVVHEAYRYREASTPRGNDPDTLPIDAARNANTLEQLAEVFQRPAVEFRRLNQFSLSDVLEPYTPVRVPDPGLAPLLAVHLAARVLADDALEERRTALIRELIPVAAINPTALDTVLSYLLIAAEPDEDVLDDIAIEVGGVRFNDMTAPAAQIGPDATMPS
jgi:hypothetical protein